MKKTKDLSSEEIKQINSLFFRVFNKEKTEEKFNQQFMGTMMGYSYHGLMMESGNIIGAYTAIPFNYQYYGKRIVFALSVDTMIDENYRGNPFNLKKMAGLVYNALIIDGIPFVFGFPNDNVYLIRKKVLGWCDIGLLDIYVLPIKIGAFFKKATLLNPFSQAASYLANNIFWTNRQARPNERQIDYPIEKINGPDFIQYRYDRSYQLIKNNDHDYFVYKIYNEDRAKAAYLIDVFPLQRCYLENAVKYIYETERSSIDFIIYLGKLSFAPRNMFRVPAKIAPRQIHMSGKILTAGLINDRIYDINNWNVNLSNFDVR